MEKYGFVYIWRDRKHKRYYIGCHWGTEDDGYICSSRWMRQSYKRRPDDFKRRILARVYTNRNDLFNEEHRFLNMIKADEVKTRYYNLCLVPKFHWSIMDDTRKTVEKIKESVKKYCEEHRQLFNSEEYRKHKSDNMKLVWKCPDKRHKLLSNRKSRQNFKHSPESRQKMSEKLKGKTAWNKGIKGLIKLQPRSEEHRKKLGISNQGKKRSEEHRLKLKEAWVRRKANNDHISKS